MSEFLVSDTSSSNSEAQKIPEQTRPVGEHKVNSVSGSPKSNSRLQLGTHQKALKDKLGLDERICANFNVETLEVQAFVNDFEGGRFDPSPIRKFAMWLNSKSGGPEYDVAIQQFRIKTAITEDQKFQKALATVIKSCNSSELPQILSAVYDLLAVDPEARRDFFIKNLLIPCLNEAWEEVSKNEIDVKNSTGKYGKFLAINQFCLNNEIKCSEEESENIKGICEKMFGRSFLEAKAAMHYAITGVEDEKI
ncbi:MAG: hypothetical protein LBD34_00645 [Puniceicoccales bacterium]|jgi:hypothetical protein|nr:hypothetical protein [Puniceicoccales bacterium]